MKYRLLTAGLLLTAISAGLWAYGSGHSSALVTSANLCPSGVGITKPFNSESVSGIVVFELTAASSYGVQSVDFILKDQLTYSGQRTDPYWRVPVDTRASAIGNGTHSLQARVVMYGAATGTTAITCYTNPVSVTVNNPTTVSSVVDKSLEVQSSLASWTGPTNVTFEVVMSVHLASGTSRTDISQQATYEWYTTRGVISPLGYRAAVSSGPYVGEGQIKVKVRHGDLIKDLVIPMKVQSQSEASTYPSVIKPDGTTTASNTSTTADDPKSIAETGENGVFKTAQSRNGQGDAELERCLSNVLGEAEYKQRIMQQPRLAYSELAKAEQCFLRRSSVVPSNLAPVEPAKVVKLPVNNKLGLERFEKATHNGKDVIRISGKALPDKTVVIYIFSEPLVLAAKADSNGEWTYVLEDPLEPGNHQAYVTVESDNNQPVRSDGFSFAIVAAPKTNLNPLGLSFAVQQVDKPRLFLWVYGVAAAGVIAVAVGVSILLLRRRAEPSRASLADGSAEAGDDDKTSSAPPAPPSQPVAGA